MELGLHRISRLVSALPSYARPTIHVTGTNGKGSTTAILSSIFHASNITSGRFNSPHLVHEWDCISLNGSPISERFYREMRTRVEAIDQQSGTRATNFELLTATAMQVFEHARVDVAIFEVGMGGRLDATNALPDECIILSAITAVALDHQSFLGRTLEQIAAEKAGIAREKKVLVVAEQITGAVKDAIKHVAELHKAELIHAPPCDKRPWETDVDGPGPPIFSTNPFFNPPPPQPVQVTIPSAQMSVKTVLGLQGDHQRQNLATALCIIATLLSHPTTTAHRTTLANRIIQATIVQGIKTARLYGRLHFVHLICPPLVPTVTWRAHELNNNLNLNPDLQLDLSVIIDGAHNHAGCNALAIYLDTLELHEPRHFVLAMSYSEDKDARETLSPLLRPGDHVALVPFSPVDNMPWIKPMSPRMMSHAVRELIGPEGVIWHSPHDDLEAETWSQPPGDVPRQQLADALRWVASRSKAAIVCGSLYFVADLYRILKQGDTSRVIGQATQSR
ncbi:Mur ligase [Auriculariales sp. MPI-PUGE-AT-0066]|nr:Mur ligase [Auriculariales sp. MPI-PUGE-AT-0066]